LTDDQPSQPRPEGAYRAFLSYSRADNRLADWLHRVLEAYRTSKELVDVRGRKLPPRLAPIFRDRTDLSSGGQLTEKIENALASSDALIVLCSPAAAQSRWVNLEVEAWLALGRETSIFPIIASGEPESGDPATECFPPALRGRGLIAADMRRDRRPDGRVIGDGREGAKLKLISGLLGVTLDALMHRERRRQRIALAISTAASVLFLILACAAAGLGYLAYQNGQRANATLNRFFASNGWAALQRQDNGLAARYALVGARLDPDNIERYRALLGAAFFQNVQLRDPIKLGSFDHAAVSPDGRLIAISNGMSDSVFDVSTGKQVWSATETTFVTSLSFSKSGAAILVVCDGFLPDGVHTSDFVALRRPADGGLIARVSSPPGANILVADLSGDAHKLVLGASEPLDAASVWNVATGGKMFALAHQKGAVTAVAFSVRGDRIYSGDNTGAIDVSDANTGVLGSQLHAHSSDVEFIGFSPDGVRMVTTSADGTAWIWDLGSARPPLGLIGHSDNVFMAAFSADGGRVVTASEDQTAKIWDPVDGRAMVTLKGHTEDVVAAGFTADDRGVITVSKDGAARVWDVSHLTEAWVALAKDACATMLAPDGVRFQPTEIEADPLLLAKWPDAARNVCTG
jgi:hypothetical protein